MASSRTSLLVAALAVLAAWPAAARELLQATAANGAAATSGSVAGYICGASDLTTLCRVITAAGAGKAATALKSATAVNTVFAPTDAAFTKDASGLADELSIRRFDDLFTTPKAAERLLANLIIPNQAILSAGFTEGRKYKDLLGQELRFSTAIFTSQRYIESEENKAEIVTPDIRVGQSVVHKTNRVPYPDD